MADNCELLKRLHPRSHSGHGSIFGNSSPGYEGPVGSFGSEFRCSVQVSAMRVALKEIPQETKDNVEKKQARTYEEIQAEQAEQELVCSFSRR